MAEVCTITTQGRSEDVPKGITLFELLTRVAPEKREEVVLAVYNGKLCELNKPLKKSGEVEFLPKDDKNGKRAVQRSLVFLMQRALMDFDDIKSDIHVEFSIGNGYYCTFEDGSKPDEFFLERLENRMRELVTADLPITKKAYNTMAARELFAERGMEDKEKLLRYRSASNTNIYDLDGCKDYFYGYMVPSTGCLGDFSLRLWDEGFLLGFSKEKYDPPEKLYNTLHKSRDWGKLMEIKTVGALNDAIAAGKTNDIILVQEALMEERIGSLASTIAKDPGKKFIMIAGPSSSGKTTFSHRLSVQLRALGLKPHPVALDNYYFNRDQMPLDEFGEKDFEAIEGLDIELFNNDMQALLRGERVELPTFNFNIGKREYKGNYMQLSENDVLVLEGIHGLNDKLSYTLPKESKFKVYISALTQLAIDEHNPLSTTDGRLIRRIVRDARCRGTSAKDTIAMWDSVHRGEQKNIFPLQEEADYMFNSALIYEMAVLKLYAEPQLYAIDYNCPEYSEAKRLIKLLDYFMPMPTESITGTSLLREFIGGSYFNV
ncbi:MAG: nucleoside kinase [Lachnospiraceae bacterium]|nr:nucleoside kinase [Lachnospiraceae bacterium]